MIPPLSIGRGKAYTRKEVIGDCTLYLGDCLEILPTIDGVNHCITDPPFEAEAHNLQRRINRGKTRGASNDVVTEEALPFAMMENHSEVARAISEVTEGWGLVFCQAEAVQKWRESFNACGSKYKRAMVWIKPDGMPQYSGDRPGMGYESIVSVWCGLGRSHWNGGGKHGVFTHNKNDNGGKKAPHPTTKPLPLMKDLVNLFTVSGQTVLDPFMGSGTTGVACASMGRGFVGIEINQEYFEVACRRIEQAYKSPDMFIARPKPMTQTNLLTD